MNPPLPTDEPAWLQQQRRTAWQVFEKLPLPSRRDQDHQHFDLRALQLDALSFPTPASAALTTTLSNKLPGQGVIFCDLPTAVAQHGDLVQPYFGRSVPADEPHKFAALQAALWRSGAFLYLPRNLRLTEPLHIHYHLTGQHVAAFSRTLVIVEPGAEATLVQEFDGGPPAGSNGSASLHAGTTEVFVGEGAKLHYVSRQNFAPHVFDFTLKRAHVARDAEIDWVLGMFGASFQRYDVECVMEAPGGTSFMYGVGVGDQHQQFGQFTRQHHRAGDTTSDLLFKNVFRDTAVGSYAGLIKVEKNANGTNAYQSNRNLVLDPAVQCDTRPILEIESNQLRCTHGATVGRLDENQLYYLRSRGLTEPIARQVLIEAFVEPVLARIQSAPVRDGFAQLIHEKLTGR